MTTVDKQTEYGSEVDPAAAQTDLPNLHPEGAEEPDSDQLVVSEWPESVG